MQPLQNESYPLFSQNVGIYNFADIYLINYNFVSMHFMHLISLMLFKTIFFIYLYLKGTQPNNRDSKCVRQNSCLGDINILMKLTHK